jgi:site-specific recombinase XerD
VRAALHKATKKTGVQKRVTPHILRHCYATHMLEQGSELPVLQAMLGHERVDTTTRYTRISAGLIARKKSPLDWLTAPR